MSWIAKRTLDEIPELPGRVDFDDDTKDRGMVNLIGNGATTIPWLPPGFYKKVKHGKLCVIEVKAGAKGVRQVVWLEKPKVRVKARQSHAGVPFVAKAV
jgi:hypothetical protein